jgi:hypothetical protein
MYFSMHWLKQVVSPLLSEVPGLGTHFSKQCSFIFYPVVSKVSVREQEERESFSRGRRRSCGDRGVYVILPQSIDEHWS